MDLHIKCSDGVITAEKVYDFANDIEIAIRPCYAEGSVEAGYQVCCDIHPRSPGELWIYAEKMNAYIHTIELHMAHSKYYVITMLDENLGIAVSVCTWIIEKCLELLSNENNYEHIHPLTAQINLDKKCTNMYVLADTHHPNWKQISKFM